MRGTLKGNNVVEWQTCKRPDWAESTHQTEWSHLSTEFWQPQGRSKKEVAQTSSQASLKVWPKGNKSDAFIFHFFSLGKIQDNQQVKRKIKIFWILSFKYPLYTWPCFVQLHFFLVQQNWENVNLNIQKTTLYIFITDVFCCMHRDRFIILFILVGLWMWTLAILESHVWSKDRDQALVLNWTRLELISKKPTVFSKGPNSWCHRNQRAPDPKRVRPGQSFPGHTHHSPTHSHTNLCNFTECRVKQCNKRNVV